VQAQTQRRLQLAALVAAALFFVAAGVFHFVDPAFFVRIVPPQLPAPWALVYVSGVFEVLGGVGLLVPATRRFAAYGLIALLVAVFPANVYMAVEADRFATELAVSPAALYVRLPLQAVFIAWVWWISVPRPSDAEGSSE
jgi:uncharacterized membrane protein